MKRQSSEVSLALFNMAGIDPAEIDAALELVIRLRQSAVLRNQHPLVQHVSQASGVRVVQLARRSRCLLVTLAAASSGTPGWTYREESARRCVFACAGVVPQPARVSLAGAPLGVLVQPHPALAAVTIAQLDESGDGWLVGKLRPAWHSF